MAHNNRVKNINKVRNIFLFPNIYKDSRICMALVGGELIKN